MSLKPDCYSAQVRWLQQAAQTDFDNEVDDDKDEDFNIADDGPPGKDFPHFARTAQICDMATA